MALTFLQPQDYSCPSPLLIVYIAARVVFQKYNFEYAFLQGFGGFSLLLKWSWRLCRSLSSLCSYFSQPHPELSALARLKIFDFLDLLCPLC